MKGIQERLAVCSWSLRAESAADLVARLRQVGLNKVQLALDPLRVGKNDWRDAGQRLADAGVEIVSGMFGCVGEDYSTLETIRRTGGIVPDATWPQTWANVQKIAPIAAQLKLKLVTFHAGFIPHDPSDPIFKKVFDRVRQITDLFSAEGIELGFETGQESATTLDNFLGILKNPRVGVNFDPANMILYASGEPVQSVKLLAPYLKQCHIKDAKKTAAPGTWGEEMPVGKGEVDWKAFFRALREANFTGHLVIEREGGNDRVGDIKKAQELVRRYLGQDCQEETR